MKRPAIVLLAMIVPALLQAQTPAPSPAVPSAAAPPPVAPPLADVIKPVVELERLQFAAGEWVHEKEIDHGGAVGVPKLGSGRSKASWILKGHALSILYKSKRSDADYEGRGVVSWDGASKRYQLDWFDSEGHARHFSGEFDPAGVLVFTTTYSLAGQSSKQSLSIKKDRNGKYLILDERAAGNGPAALYIESLAAPAPAAPRAPVVPADAPPATTKPTTYP